jgi:hypothetical protein
MSSNANKSYEQPRRQYYSDPTREIVAELFLNKRECFRIEAETHPNGSVVMALGRWKVDANGVYHRGPSFPYGRKRASGIAALIVKADEKISKGVR